MKRVHLFCEGQTEESFVNNVLQPHFSSISVFLNPILVRTSPQGKGGVVSYNKLRWQIEHKCKEDKQAWVTTFLDFYRLPKDFPTTGETGSAMQRATAIEQAVNADIGQPNFFAYLVVHEFEALLFSEPSAFALWFGDDTAQQIQEIKQQFDTPEHINEGATTAPSKRLLSLCAHYDKVQHGSLLAIDMGLDIIRQTCPRFNRWIELLETL